MPPSKHLSSPPTDQDRHIVDILIEERAVELIKRPLLWRFIKRYLYPLLGYEEAQKTAATLASMSGSEVLHYLCSKLSMEIEVSGAQSVEPTGLAFATVNHPAGITDGIAVFEALHSVRDDIAFFANRDAVRISPNATDTFIPVEWRPHLRTREKTREMLRALSDCVAKKKIIVVFPSGRLAQPTIHGLVERPWTPTALRLARKYDAPIIPINIQSKNSLLYYFFWFVNTVLRDMTLFREGLNKRAQRYRIRIGEAFRCESDVETETQALRHFVVNEMPDGLTQFCRSGRRL